MFLLDYLRSTMHNSIVDRDKDFDGDGSIGVNDLLFVVGEWGLTASEADLDESGTVDTPDLLAVIAAWGVCE